MVKLNIFPLIEADDSGAVLVPMFPTDDDSLYKRNGKMYLEEFMAHRFQLNNFDDSRLLYSISCPYCGKEMLSLNSTMDGTAKKIYVCTYCD